MSKNANAAQKRREAKKMRRLRRVRKNVSLGERKGKEGVNLKDSARGIKVGHQSGNHKVGMTPPAKTFTRRMK